MVGRQWCSATLCVISHIIGCLLYLVLCVKTSWPPTHARCSVVNIFSFFILMVISSPNNVEYHVAAAEDLTEERRHIDSTWYFGMYINVHIYNIQNTYIYIYTIYKIHKYIYIYMYIYIYVIYSYIHIYPLERCWLEHVKPIASDLWMFFLVWQHVNRRFDLIDPSSGLLQVDCPVQLKPLCLRPTRHWPLRLSPHTWSTDLPPLKIPELGQKTRPATRDCVRSAYRTHVELGRIFYENSPKTQVKVPKLWRNACVLCFLIVLEHGQFMRYDDLPIKDLAIFHSYITNYQRFHPLDGITSLFNHN